MVLLLQLSLSKATLLNVLYSIVPMSNGRASLLRSTVLLTRESHTTLLVCRPQAPCSAYTGSSSDNLRHWTIEMCRYSIAYTHTLSSSLSSAMFHTTLCELHTRHWQGLLNILDYLWIDPRCAVSSQIPDLFSESSFLSGNIIWPFTRFSIAVEICLAGYNTFLRWVAFGWLW